MTSKDAKKRLTECLKSLSIPFALGTTDDTADLVIIFKNCPNCPDSMLECSIYLYEDCMEVKTYYDKNAAGWVKQHKERHAEIYRILNYINANVWLGTPFSNRIYMTEDGCYDITLSTIIEYDFYETSPIKAEEYITAFCPDLLNQLSPVIFMLLLGKYDIQQAISMVDGLTTNHDVL